MKRMIKSSIDRSTDGSYQQLFADVLEVVRDNLIESCIPATDMQQKVSGYNADWHSEDYKYDDNAVELENAVDELAQRLTEYYLRNYSPEVEE